jgi:hypothetical protein
MTVKRVGTSQIVSLGARASTAVDAARLTNEIAGAFVQELYDANAVITTNAALRERIKGRSGGLALSRQQQLSRQRQRPSWFCLKQKLVVVQAKLQELMRPYAGERVAAASPVLL